MTADQVGVLDTNTLFLIDRLDPESLPAEPVITAGDLVDVLLAQAARDDDLRERLLIDAVRRGADTLAKRRARFGCSR